MKSADAKQRLIEKYGLDQPAIIQYGKWVGNVLRGDLGYSMSSHQPVLEGLLARLPYTLELTIFSLIPVIFVGIWLGVKSGVHHNRPLDQGIRIFAIVGWSLPDFVFGLLILMLFYSQLGWFPPGLYSLATEQAMRMDNWTHYTRMVTFDAILNWRWDIFLDGIRHLVAPVLTLAYLWWAFLLRVTRSSMLDVLSKDYIRTARAKGLSEKVVINKHARRNALIPVITVAGHMVVQLMAGVVIVETIFTRPGIGTFSARAAQQLDYFAIIGFAFFFSLILVIGNLIVDISYALIDPRIRLS
jgi:peptide/nickel transport system permease protein